MNPVLDEDPAPPEPPGGRIARECAGLRTEIRAAAAVLDAAMPQLLAGFRGIVAGTAGSPALRQEIEQLVVALQFHDVLAQGFDRMQERLVRLERLDGGAAAEDARAWQPGEIELF